MTKVKAANSFAVRLADRNTDPNNFYKERLLNYVKTHFPKFTIAGENPPPVGRGVEYASHGNALTFGTAKTHDVEWVERPEYLCEKGYAPIYDIVKDWNKITERLGQLYAERYPAPRRLSNGMEVEYFKNFVKVGYNRVSYSDLDTILALYYGIAPKVKVTTITFTNDDVREMYFNLRG
jgi:hypothetical protein